MFQDVFEREFAKGQRQVAQIWPNEAPDLLQALTLELLDKVQQDEELAADSASRDRTGARDRERQRPTSRTTRAPFFFLTTRYPSGMATTTGRQTMFELLEKVFKALQPEVIRRFGDRGEEILQNLMVEALEGAQSEEELVDRFSREDDLYRWLRFRLPRRHIDMIRAERVRPGSSLEDGPELVEDEIPVEELIIAEALRPELREVLHRAMGHLNTRDRRVIEYCQQYHAEEEVLPRTPEIAEEFGLKYSTAGGVLSRALDRVREALEDEGIRDLLSLPPGPKGG